MACNGIYGYGREGILAGYDPVSSNEGPRVESPRPSGIDGPSPIPKEKGSSPTTHLRVEVLHVARHDVKLEVRPVVLEVIIVPVQLWHI